MVWCMIAIFAFLQPALAYTYFSEEPGSCQIIGDADVYGIGIRLGFYLQYISVVLCIIFDRIEDLKTARQGFNAFSLAALINLYRNATKTLPIEWYICIYLVLFIPLAAGPRSEADFNNSFSTLLIQNMLYVSIILACPWLAYHGMQIGYKPGCDLRLFCFMRSSSLYAPSVLSAAKVTSIIGVIIAPILLIYPVAFAVYPFTIVATETLSGRANYHRDDRDSSTPWALSKCGRLVARICIITIYLLGPFSILSLEMSIRCNHIGMAAGPITAAGQLIPLIIGSYVLITTVLMLVKKPFLPIGEYIRKSMTDVILRTIRVGAVDEEMGIFGSEAHLAEQDGQAERAGDTENTHVIRKVWTRDAGTQVTGLQLDVQSEGSRLSIPLHRCKTL